MLSRLRPLEKRDLFAGARGLVLVPHGALTYLPFSALRDSPRSPYLAERFSIITLTSASALVPLRQTTTEAASGGQVFAPLTKELPASRDEATAVSRALTAHASLDADASEAAVRRALRSASIVHVASHGILDADRPMFSAVALAPSRTASTPDDDGRLETHEVLGLDVASRLVYLSGCETALGASGPTSFHTGEDYTTRPGLPVRGRAKRRRDTMANRRPRRDGIRDTILPGAVRLLSRRRSRRSPTRDDPRPPIRSAVLLGRLHHQRRRHDSIRSSVVDSTSWVAEPPSRRPMCLGALPQILELTLQIEQLVVAQPLHVHQFVSRRANRADELVHRVRVDRGTPLARRVAPTRSA